MDVADSRVAERLGERPLVELRIPPAAGEAADIDERLGLRLAQNSDELLERAATVSDRQHAHLLRIVPVLVGERGIWRRR